MARCTICNALGAKRKCDACHRAICEGDYYLIVTNGEWHGVCKPCACKATR